MQVTRLTEEQVEQITNEAYLEHHDEYNAMSEAQREAFDYDYAKAVIKKFGMDTKDAVEFAIECAQEYNDWADMYNEGMELSIISKFTNLSIEKIKKILNLD